MKTHLQFFVVRIFLIEILVMCILRKYIHPVVVGLQARLRDFYTGHQKFKQLSEQNQVKILLPGKYLLFFFFFLSHKRTPMS